MTSPAQKPRRGTGKRGNHEGSIYPWTRQRPRKNGPPVEETLWCAAVTLSDGKRKVLYARTREAVAEKLATALGNLQRGIKPSNQRETVTSWVTQYIDELERNGAAHGTIVRYRGILKNHLAPALGKYKLAQLEPQHFRKYQGELLDNGASASTVTTHRAVLGGALNQAVRDGLIPRNIVSLVKPPRDDSEPIGTMLTPAQARAFLDQVRGDRNEAFYLLLLTAGLRRGEALGLRWIDLDLDNPQGAMVHVRQQLQWPDGKATQVPLKTRKSVRAIPLPSVTVEVLRARREAQLFERAAIGDENWHADGLVFNAEDGDPLHRNTFVKQLHSHRRAAGLPYFRPHDLRHTYGSLLMSRGVPLKTISELMGHASIEITADIYLHSLDVQVRDTARSVEEALSATPALGPGSCPACGRALAA